MKPVTKEELLDLSRKDLNKLAEKEYGVVDASKFANKGLLADEVLKNLKAHINNIEVEVEEVIVEAEEPAKPTEFVQITNIKRSMKGGAVLSLSDKHFPINVDNHFIATNRPSKGDYVRSNANGTTSYESKESFERE